ncbi:MAG: hypothetical protein ACTSQC_06050 [Candidatus Heimdallarchaeaceae archaeon]
MNKKIKTKLFTSLSVLIISFLLSTSSLNAVSTKALINTNEDQFNTDSFDSSTWKWNTTEVVSTESTEPSSHPSLAADAEGNVHIAWCAFTFELGVGTYWDIYYKRWDTFSSSWTTTEYVSTESAGDSVHPSLAVDSAGNVHVAWEDYTNYASSGIDTDIFYKLWNVTTSSWTTTEVVSTESTDSSYEPSLAIGTEGNVHISWLDETDYVGSGSDADIFYKHWEASTSSWTTTEVVSTESTGNSLYPSLAVDAEGNVRIAWQDQTDYLGAGTESDIFYKSWDASTSTWSVTEVVSTEGATQGGSTSPSLAVDTAGNVHITWEGVDIGGTLIEHQIYYKYKNALTQIWSTSELVSTESLAFSGYPFIDTDLKGNIHISWIDETDYDISGTDFDIFYKSWEAYSSSWTTTVVVSTESTDYSGSPSLAVDTIGQVHIAWEDYTDYAGAGTDPDIFYKFLACPPASALELAFIVPNPTEISSIYLDWNDVFSANSYHVYRSTSYIWSVEELAPITTVSSSEYIDTVPHEGYFYYVVVAANFAGNSSISNCQYVEVSFPDLEAPRLAPILPNPTELTSISLVWDEIDGATEYHVYRSASYIWSVVGLLPIAAVGVNSFVDSLPSEGYYFYVIVANDGVRNSTLSNCEYVEYKLPTLHEFFIISSLIIGLPILLFVVTRIRKKKSKMS